MSQKTQVKIRNLTQYCVFLPHISTRYSLYNSFGLQFFKEKALKIRLNGKKDLEN